MLLPLLFWRCGQIHPRWWSLRNLPGQIVMDNISYWLNDLDIPQLKHVYFLSIKFFFRKNCHYFFLNAIQMQPLTLPHERKLLQRITMETSYIDLYILSLQMSQSQLSSHCWQACLPNYYWKKWPVTWSLTHKYGGWIRITNYVLQLTRSDHVVIYQWTCYKLLFILPCQKQHKLFDLLTLCENQQC